MLVLDGSATDRATSWRSRTAATQVSRFAGDRSTVVDRAHGSAAELSTRIDIYGRTTGVGANRHAPVPADRLRLRNAAAAQLRGRRRAIRSRTTTGSRDARGAARCSSVFPVRDSIPTILGDLASGCSTTMPCPSFASTRRSVPATSPRCRHGTDIDRRAARRRKPLTPMSPWGADSALPFMSSSALTIGRSCLALEELSPPRPRVECDLHAQLPRTRR